MSLRFIYGRAGSGKTTRCLDEIKARLGEEAENPLVLLVPEQFTFQAERDLINRLGRGGILRTEVLSFRRLAFRVFNDVGGITRPHMHSAGKCMILYRLLDKMRDRLAVFSRSADRQGFVNTLSALITEFKRYNITPAALEAAAAEMEDANPLKGKLTELHLIYEAFEKTLEERYRDSDDDLALAAEKLGETMLYNGAEIWIDGFAGFTPQELKLTGRLLQKADRVSVSLCTDGLDGSCDVDGADIFAAVRNTYRKFQKLARELGIGLELPVLLNSDPLPRFKASPELAHLERNLYAYPYKAWKENTRDLSLFSSVSMFSEVEAAAADIVRLCRDDCLRWRDIAVVTRDLAGYEKLIEVVFAEYGIPCFIDRKLDIANHPLIRLILSMLDIFNENWTYEAVFRYLKTGMTGIPRGDIDRLENYVLACGIRGSRWTDGQDWKMSPGLLPDQAGNDGQGELLESVNRVKALVAAPLLEFRSKVKGRKKASEICAGLYDFLCTLKVPERIEDSIEAFRKSGRLELANEYSQVWNIVMEVFDQTVEVMGDETFGVERFTDILKIGFGEYKIGLIPASLDQVLAGSVERSRSHEIKALYILGANDGKFPSSAAAEGILSDRDRAELGGAGVELASDTRMQAFDEQFLVYRAMTAPGTRLRISWPIADQEGRTLRPSMIVGRLRKLFPAIAESSNILGTDSAPAAMGQLSSRMPAFRHMVSALRRKADGRELTSVWQEAWRWFAAQEEWRQKCRAVRTAFGYRNLAQEVSRDKILALYGDPAVSSVSRLEKFTACPFAFYVQYGLGARERKIFRLTPPDVGTFMHAVIERFSRLVSEGDTTWRGVDREWCNARVSEIVDGMLGEMRGSGIAASKRYTAMIVRLKRVVARSVWLIAEHIRRSGFDPIEYEVGFGEREKYPPIVIELDSGERINLTGRIDRVDALKTEEGTFLRIIDYKSGSKDFKLADVFYGLQIQLITYLDAIWGETNESGDGSSTRCKERVEEPSPDSSGSLVSSRDPEQGERFPEPHPSLTFPAGMLYFKVDDPIIRGSGIISEEEVERAIMKQLKMRGLLLADVKLIRQMDNTIEGTSLIIPATINKGDVLGKNTSAATLDQFTLLRKYIKKLLKDLCGEIMNGNASISPYKKKSTTACKYCSFLSVCQFDTAMKENAYRLLYEKEDGEVWDLFSEGGPAHE